MSSSKRTHKYEICIAELRIRHKMLHIWMKQKEKIYIQVRWFNAQLFLKPQTALHSTLFFCCIALHLFPWRCVKKIDQPHTHTPWNRRFHDQQFKVFINKFLVTRRNWDYNHRHSVKMKEEIIYANNFCPSAHHLFMIRLIILQSDVPSLASAFVCHPLPFRIRHEVVT